MSTEIWKIVVWSLMTFGIAGTIVLFVLFPNIVSVVFKLIVTAVQTELSYRIGCALTAAVITGFAVDYWRHSRDDAEFAERTVQFEQAQVDRDKQIADDTRDQVWIEIANQTALNQTTDTEVKEFHDALPPIATADACNDVVRVGANAGRLRTLAGAPVSRPVSIKRVPKARTKAAGT